VTYAQRGQFNRALVDLNQAIRLNPRYGQAYVTRAMVYLDKKDYAKAKQDIRKAQSLKCRVPPKVLRRMRQASRRTR
jgi:Tfp pilus assembly protein PilF